MNIEPSQLTGELNAFAYDNGNPLSYIDPEGLLLLAILSVNMHMMTAPFISKLSDSGHGTYDFVGLADLHC